MATHMARIAAEMKHGVFIIDKPRCHKNAAALALDLEPSSV
jgi:hypothetical protein